MNRSFFFFVLGLVLSSLLSFAVMKDHEVTNKTAEVNQITGFYVFVDSRPVKEYEYLATVKNGLSFSGGQYQSVRDILLRKARKQYPAANGLIIHFANGGVDKADIIRFKD